MTKCLLINLMIRLSLSSQNMVEGSVTVSGLILVDHHLKIFRKSKQNDKVISKE